MNIKIDWISVKGILDSKNLKAQYVQAYDAYFVGAIDGVFSLYCKINIVSNPATDSDQYDFETNYKANSNKTLAFSTGGTFIDHSGTTSVTPDTSTQVMPANLNRKYLFIQNIDDAIVWINFTSAATAGQASIELLPGAAFVLEGSSISTEAVNIVSQSVNIPYTAKEK